MGLLYLNRAQKVCAEKLIFKNIFRKNEIELLSPCGKQWNNRVYVPVHAVVSIEALICGEPTVAIRLVCAGHRRYRSKIDK